MEKEFSNSMVSVAGLPDMDLIEYAPISRAYLWVLLLSGLFRYAVIFLSYFILAFSFRDVLPLGVRRALPLVLLCLMIFAFYRLYKVFQKKGYALREHDISYKTGWLWKKVTTIPYHRIQHCEISSGPLERIFDLSTLNVYTAGGSQSDLSIPGLLEPEGRRLKKWVLMKMGEDDEEE